MDSNLIAPAIEKVNELFGEFAARNHEKYFSAFCSVKGAGKIFRKITKCGDKEQVLDYLNEVRFTLFFTGVGFTVEIEPHGKKGPDLRLSGHEPSVLVEVTRFRPINPGPKKLTFDEGPEVLSPYGDPQKDVLKAINKIVSKFTQLGDEKAIIAVWNDDQQMEEVEVRCAVKSIVDAMEKGGGSVPENLLFLLYASEWISSKQIFCFEFAGQLDDKYQELIKVLEGSIVSQLVNAGTLTLLKG